MLQFLSHAEGIFRGNVDKQGDKNVYVFIKIQKGRGYSDSKYQYPASLVPSASLCLPFYTPNDINKPDTTYSFIFTLYKIHNIAYIKYFTSTKQPLSRVPYAYRVSKKLKVFDFDSATNRKVAWLQSLSRPEKVCYT